MPLLDVSEGWDAQPDYFPAIRYDDPIGQMARIALIGGYNPVEVCTYATPGGTMGTVEGTPGGLAYVLPSTATTWAPRDIFSLDPKIGNSIAVHWYGMLRSDTDQFLIRFIGGYGWELRTASWGPDLLRFQFGGYWQGGGISSAPQPLDDKTLHSVTAIVDAQTGITTIYLDGISVVSGAWSGDGGAGFGQILPGQVVSMFGSATKPHKMLTVQAFTGPFTLGHMRTLINNPYHIFEESESFQWIPGGGVVVPPTFNAAWARNANSIITGAVR